MAPIPPAASPCTRSASSYWMLSADIIRTLLLRPGTILDTTENSPLALPQFVGDSRFHSKASVDWSSAELYMTLLFHKHRSFFCFFRDSALRFPKNTLGSGVDLRARQRKVTRDPRDHRARRLARTHEGQAGGPYPGKHGTQHISLRVVAYNGEF